MKTLPRREMLKQLGVGLSWALFPLSGSAAEQAKAAELATAPPALVPYRFRVGGIEAAVIPAGFLETKAAAPAEATAEEFRQALQAEGIVGRLRLPFNVMVLWTGGHTVLIDAGPGDAPSKPSDLVAHLASLGVQPRDVTHVILTHAHFDHVGGLLDADDRLVFARAEHFCRPEEIDFWMAERPDFSRLRMKSAGLLATARRAFTHVPFTRLGEGMRLPQGLVAFHSPGHTPGHLTVQVESRGESLYHIADLAQHYALTLPHPDWSAISDVDPLLAATTRRAVFSRLAAERRRVFGFHLPYPGLGRLVGQGSGYRWISEGQSAMP